MVLILQHWQRDSREVADSICFDFFLLCLSLVSCVLHGPFFLLVLVKVWKCPVNFAVDPLPLRITDSPDFCSFALDRSVHSAQSCRHYF